MTNFYLFLYFFQYQEFDVYDKYAHDILMPESREKLMYLLQLPNVGHALQVWNFIDHIMYFCVFVKVVEIKEQVTKTFFCL